MWPIQVLTCVSYFRWMRKLASIIFLILFGGMAFSQTWTQMGQDIDGAAIGDLSGNSVSFSANGTRLAIGAQRIASGNGAGQVRVYDWDGVQWIQAGQDINGVAFDDFSGKSLSISADGNRLAIGAPGNDGAGGNAGHVRVYEWNGMGWIRLGQDIDGEFAGDRSGESVSISADGNRLAIGAPFNDGGGSGSGQVRVFDWDGAQWIQLGQDIDGEAPGDLSGRVSISSNGDRVAIGAIRNDANLQI